MGGVSVGIWITAGLTVFVVMALTIWVTNKAYSRKWEESDDESDLLK
ncbi:MAG: hypothetical protein K0R75_611 [Paenibacillaceae bacterium]|jgi:hypothetical protein|nr:hypothetical protein [Paenibacillaceae bacterium]